MKQDMVSLHHRIWVMLVVHSYEMICQHVHLVGMECSHMNTGL